MVYDSNVALLAAQWLLESIVGKLALAVDT
jgi:hypothetical protein